ncbi:MAG: hypothetical protein IT460_01355 [Planctomycetes bacterium]|nr:hypothetical protein [Planctomycetota bacterium]
MDPTTEDVPPEGLDSAPGAARPPVDASRGVPPDDRPPLVVPGAGRIRREALDDNAVFVVRHLRRMGHEAYLVGGCVRDLLLGLEPKDFDVATDATPNRVKRLFRSAFVIGRRFRLVHVRFPGNAVVETATFRRNPGTQGLHPERQDGPIYDDNVFGTAAEDAWRRDFSVNALFYDPVEDQVVDHVGGLADLETRTIRALGDAETRIKEDPVRMLRAVHFAARLGGSIEPGLRDAIRGCAAEIEKASRSRLYVELLKVLGRGAASPTMRGLHELGLLRHWLPELAAFLETPIPWPASGGGSHAAAREGEPEDTPPSHLTWNLLGAADAWGLAAHGVPESLPLACLLGPWLLDGFVRGPRRGADVWQHVEETFRPLALQMNVPRKTSWELREILGLLDRLRHPPAAPKRRRQIVDRAVFPEALVYFELDLRARGHDLEPARRWREEAEAAYRAPSRRPADDDGPEPAPDELAPDAPPTDGAADDDLRGDLGAADAVIEGDAPGGRRRRRRGGRGRGRGRRRGPADLDGASAPTDPLDAFTDAPASPTAPTPRAAPPPRAERAADAGPVAPRVERPTPPPPAPPPPAPRPPSPPSLPAAPPAPPATAREPRPAPRAPARPADDRPFGAGIA